MIAEATAIRPGRNSLRPRLALTVFALSAVLALSACGGGSSSKAERDAKAALSTERARADAYDPRVALADALVPRGERFVPRGQAQGILRTPRTGPAGHRKLAIRTDPVAFTAGKRVGAARGGLVATDELPLRSVTLRAAGRHPIRIQGDDGTPSTYSNTDGVLESSLRLSGGGVTLKFGGEGVVYYDMQRYFDYYGSASDTTPGRDDWWRYGPDGKLGDASAAAGQTMTASHARDLGLSEASGMLTAGQATALQGYVTDNSGACWRAQLSDCGDWAHDDLTVNFGTASQSPQGEASYYWKVRAPFFRSQVANGFPATVDPEDGDGRPQELGTYELWLSNYGGVDDKGTETRTDDTHRYLEYAAYGLFMVFDNVKQTPSFVRPQAFATGYDAFQDEAGMRTTDVATSIAATFRGHTTARALTNNGDENNITLTGGTPLRGDITLNACIGAGACAGSGIPTTANRISGTISDLQELRHDGVWIPYNSALSIPMMEGDINADGSFGGRLDHPRTSTGGVNSWNYDNTAASKYGGNFYGPRNGLEAAGWWHMVRDERDRGRHSSIIGSFGAKCASGCGN